MSRPIWHRYENYDLTEEGFSTLDALLFTLGVAKQEIELIDNAYGATFDIMEEGRTMTIGYYTDE